MTEEFLSYLQTSETTSETSSDTYEELILVNQNLETVTTELKEIHNMLSFIFVSILVIFVFKFFLNILGSFFGTN